MIRYRLRESTRTYFPCPEGMDRTLHALLMQRGIASAEEAERFLNPRAQDLRDPFLLNDMAVAVERIRAALAQKLPICVYGDYDVDGVSASAILADYLRSQGAKTEVYLPSRHNEGYGLNEEAIRAIAERNRMMITVDCGVTSVELIELAKSLGLECIVTDHHRPAETLPDCPVINPLLNEYPFPSLCGAGVAFKLVHALGGLQAAMAYVDIAALATVADVVPLTDENRVIVKLGLDRINTAPRPGIRALIEGSGLSEKKISAGNIAFQLAPRLNAGGRIGSARRSHDLLLCSTAQQAQPYADELETENTHRKQIEQQILAEAEKQLENFDFPAHRILVLAGSGWNPGVIGLTASRLVEKYHYPVILLSESEGVLVGSCRSIPGVDIHAALTAVKDRLVKYGGHKQAAGLTLMATELDAFRAQIDAYLWKEIHPACYIPDQEYDLQVSLDELSEAFVAKLDALQPTGFGNPAPVLRSTCTVIDHRDVGLNGAHLKMLLSENGKQCGSIFFRAGGMDLPETVDVLYSPKIDTFARYPTLSLEIKSLVPGDVLSEIDSKIEDEIELQQEFLTQMLYNKEINFYNGSCRPISMEDLQRMLNESPQGTLVLTADLAQTQRILSAQEGHAPDVFMGKLPEDARAFNAVCAYPPAELPSCYRRIVLVGVPECVKIPEDAEVYRLEVDVPWLSKLPDVDQMREVYKAVRGMHWKARAREDRFRDLTYAIEQATGLDELLCAASLLALNDMQLIRLSLSPLQLTQAPMRKTDPDSSAVWRAVQRWRGKH